MLLDLAPVRRGRSANPRSFAGLMELYEQNYIRLRNIAPDLAVADEMISSVPEHQDLFLSITERCKYTTMLRMTYQFEDEGQLLLEPDLHLKIYHDARMVEVQMGVDHVVDVARPDVGTLESGRDLLAGLELDLDERREAAQVSRCVVLARQTQPAVKKRAASRVIDQIGRHGDPHLPLASLDQRRERHLQPTTGHCVESQAHGSSRYPKSSLRDLRCAGWA